MRRACVAAFLLAGACGFRASATVDSGVTDDGGGSGATDAARVCWTLNVGASFQMLQACSTQVATIVRVTDTVEINTDLGTSKPAGVPCEVVTVATGLQVCAVFAETISIQAGGKLTATGDRPLALLGHNVTIAGTIDVASHTGGQTGPSGGSSGCTTFARGVAFGGGGAGGRFSRTAGNGGDAASHNNSGGKAPVGSISTTILRGGCDGQRGGDSTAGGGTMGPAGGKGGGAIWIASDMGPLVIAGGTINASGASATSGAVGLNAGGGGGGSGGMILLQAMTITGNASSKVFANGGHGGNGTQDAVAGAVTTDPDGPTSGGDYLAGGPVGGIGGIGAAKQANGTDGEVGANNGTGGGGGGGGGGAGEVYLATGSAVTADFSPNPQTIP